MWLTRVSRTDTDDDAVEQLERAAVPLAFTPHYCDTFVVSAPHHLPARVWAERCLAGAARANGLFATVVWHGALGFDLAPDGTEATLVGWRIVEDSEHRFEVAADGDATTARMVFLVADGAARWTTALRFRQRLSRSAWTLLSPVHRALGPRLLTRAARRS